MSSLVGWVVWRLGPVAGPGLAGTDAAVRVAARLLHEPPSAGGGAEDLEGQAVADPTGPVRPPPTPLWVGFWTCITGLWVFGLVRALLEDDGDQIAVAAGFLLTAVVWLVRETVSLRRSRSRDARRSTRPEDARRSATSVSPIPPTR